MSTEDLFQIQAGFINESINLIDDRVAKIEGIGKAADFLTAFDKERIHAVTIFKARSLKQYRHILRFLAGELINNEEGRHYFSLPHLRTIFDIYARLLHLSVSCVNDDQRALICIAYHVYSSSGFEETYATSLDTYKEFLSNMDVVFPISANEMNYRVLQKKHLVFGSPKQLLSEENIKSFAPYSSDIFGANNSYGLYANFSEHLHGNPYLFNSNAHNERFWIAALAIVYTAFLIELIDRESLSKIQSRDFRLWLRDVGKNRPSFTALWQQERIRRNSRITGSHG